jgi:hypothetical protein
MLQHFRFIPYLAGLALGLVILLGYTAPPRVIFEYPHPTALQHKVYRDQTGICIQYSAEEVNCDANEATLRDYPLQS